MSVSAQKRKSSTEASHNNYILPQITVGDSIPTRHTVRHSAIPTKRCVRDEAESDGLTPRLHNGPGCSQPPEGFTPSAGNPACASDQAAHTTPWCPENHPHSAL